VIIKDRLSSKEFYPQGSRERELLHSEKKVGGEGGLSAKGRKEKGSSSSARGGVLGSEDGNWSTPEQEGKNCADPSNDEERGGSRHSYCNTVASGKKGQTKKKAI